MPRIGSIPLTGSQYGMPDLLIQGEERHSIPWYHYRKANNTRRCHLRNKFRLFKMIAFAEAGNTGNLVPKANIASGPSTPRFPSGLQPLHRHAGFALLYHLVVQLPHFSKSSKMPWPRRLINRDHEKTPSWFHNYSPFTKILSIGLERFQVIINSYLSQIYHVPNIFVTGRMVISQVSLNAVSLSLRKTHTVFLKNTQNFNFKS